MSQVYFDEFVTFNCNSYTTSFTLGREIGTTVERTLYIAMYQEFIQTQKE